MLDNFSCTYDTELNIFRISWDGLTTPSDVREMWINLVLNGNIPKDCKGFLVDQSNIELESGFSGYKTVTDVFKEYGELFKQRKIAVLVDGPKLTAEFIMMQRQSEGANLKPFCEEFAAIRWILM
ncbi:MAG: hypothetical protein ACK5MI_10005 [Mangrovibacterium sp.]